MAVNSTENRAPTRAARDTPRIFLSRRRKSNAPPKPITSRATAGAVFFTSPGGHRALFGESFDIPPRFIGIESVGGCSCERRPLLSTHRCRNQPHRKSLPNHPECASEPIGSFSGEVFLLTPRPRCQVVCHAIRSAACQWTVRTTCTAIMRSDSSPCRTSFPVRRMHRRSENINTGLHSDGNRFRQGSFREQHLNFTAPIPSQGGDRPFTSQ